MISLRAFRDSCFPFFRRRTVGNVFIAMLLVSALATRGISQDSDSHKPVYQYAYFGGGCFWCMEAVFERVWGVQSVVSGYAGGTVPNPTYELVLTDQTGHAEVVRVEFDPDIVSYEELLMIFFKTHDPTSLNHQGPDEGTRYRSVVLYVDSEQKESAENVMAELKDKKVFRKKLVTELSAFARFYPAEDYHQDYFAKHPEKPYCELNINPKIGKFERAFKKNSKQQKTKEKKNADRNG